MTSSPITSRSSVPMSSSVGLIFLNLTQWYQSSKMHVLSGRRRASHVIFSLSGAVGQTLSWCPSSCPASDEGRVRLCVNVLDKLRTCMTSSLCEQSCLVMDPSLRLSCEELLELPYFGEEGGANWGRESERPGRRHDKGSRRRQAGVSVKTPSLRTTRVMRNSKLVECVHSAQATHQ